MKTQNTYVDKRFKAFSFIWLLVCFFLTHYYFEQSGIDGLMMRIFMYGLFAAPVWLVFGWHYLHGTTDISKVHLLVITSLYLAWYVYELEQRNNTAWPVLACLGYFFTLAPIGIFKGPKMRAFSEGIIGFLIGCYQGVTEMVRELLQFAGWLYLGIGIIVLVFLLTGYF